MPVMPRSLGNPAFVVLSILLVAWGVQADNVPLTMLTDSKAKCLDGTQAGYYAQAASNPASKNKWVIYLNGGGECDSESACKSTLTGPLGSSKYFQNETNANGWFLASDSCTYNPSFCDWNHAYDPYCTQDLHAGQVTEPKDSNFNMYFSGHHVFTAMLDALDANYNLKDATEIILSGASAGGIGVWMNVDYLQQRYRKAKVTAMTVAGHYFYATYYEGTNHTNPGGMADFRASAWDQTYALYEAYVDESCKKAYKAQGLSPSPCLLSNNSLPHIEVDAFVVQAMTDQVVLTGHDCWPETYMQESEERAFMQQWSDNMTIALKPFRGASKASTDISVKGTRPLHQPRRGAFAVACYTHTGFNHAYPLLNGLSYSEAFSRFYFDSDTSGNADAYYQADDCGLMCNPTCNGV